MIRWFYFPQQDPPEMSIIGWRGANELRRLSSVVLRQKRFTLGPIKFFYGPTEIEVEVVWRFANQPATLTP